MHIISSSIKNFLAFFKSKQFEILFLVVIIGGYFVFNLYTSTQIELRKTQDQLNSLKQSTHDAISTQQTLLEQQGNNLSKQDEALKKSQANEALLRNVLSVESSKNSTSIIDGSINQIASSIVKIACLVDSYSGDTQQGSGVLYKSNTHNQQEFGPYFVRTNLHVVNTQDGSPSQCVIAVYPDYKNAGNYLLFKSDGYRFYHKDIDVAYLLPTVIENNGNVSAGSLNDLNKYATSEESILICRAINIGEHLSIFGYPGVGGDTLTVTDGIVSGFEFDSSVRYVKTSAKIEHGNSGGIAIKDSGCIIGIPTFVQQGSIESIGRILDFDYLFNIALKKQ